jgi:hypothetical protein
MSNTPSWLTPPGGRWAQPRSTRVRIVERKLRQARGFRPNGVDHDSERIGLDRLEWAKVDDRYTSTDYPDTRTDGGLLW